jgi:hypothetical protein
MTHKLMEGILNGLGKNVGLLTCKILTAVLLLFFLVEQISGFGFVVKFILGFFDYSPFFCDDLCFCFRFLTNIGVLIINKQN